MKNVSPDENFEEDAQMQNVPYEGRRLVELDLIAMEAWCNSCQQAISLRYKVDEKFHGIVSIIQLKCQYCDQIVTVHTSKKSHKSFHDTNMKLAVGKYHGKLLKMKIIIYNMNVILQGCMTVV